MTLVRALRQVNRVGEQRRHLLARAGPGQAEGVRAGALIQRARYAGSRGA
jgi:hypothetical protein